MDNNEVIWLILFYIVYLGVFVFLLVVYKSDRKGRKSGNEPFGKNEITLTLIFLYFLKLKKHSNEQISTILSEIFDNYSEKLFIEKSTYTLQIIISDYQDREVNLNKTLNNLKGFSTKQKLFLLYSLLDISAADKIYSKEEEDFIEMVRLKIKIPLQTFQAIKSSYIKKGLKDERTIEAEKRRKQAVQSYLPYNAYKVLGVTSSVSKEELKKVYRTLAKKFHPDKFHGKSEELITKAEEKFEEITRAYEFIKKQRKI